MNPPQSVCPGENNSTKARPIDMGTRGSICHRDAFVPSAQNQIGIQPVVATRNMVAINQIPKCVPILCLVSVIIFFCRTYYL